MKRWAVVGGGFLGMRVASRLARAGALVDLYEAEEQLGGLAAPWTLGLVAWDRHYHVILESDRRLLGLVSELGLSDRLRWGRTTTGFWHQGSMHALDGAIDLLRFKPLSLISRLRLGATLALAPHLARQERLDELTVGAWIGSWSGREALETVWAPLLAAKLGDAWREASARFLWATMVRLLDARKRADGSERFGWVEGGYRTIIEAFERSLRKDGVEIRTGQRVLACQRRSETAPDPGPPLTIEARATTASAGPGTAKAYDGVVLALASPLAAEICPDLSSAVARALMAPRYLGVVCTSLLLERPLAGHYITNVADPEIPFTGIIEMSALVGTEPFGGHHLVYLPRYVAPDAADFELSDDTLIEEGVNALRRITPSFAAGDLVAARVSRVRRVVTIPIVGAAQAVPPVQSGIPGLYLGTSAQIQDGTRFVDATLGLAEEVLSECLSDLESAGD